MKIDVKHVAKQTKSQKLKDQAKKFFQDIGSIDCPAFGVLNSKTRSWKN